MLGYYEDWGRGQNRRDTYRRMADTILGAGARRQDGGVPPSTATPASLPASGHMAIKDARAEVYVAEMLPGISALDCLVADLGLDPGRMGMQSMETTQFMIYQRRIDPTALLILWQPFLAGELSLKRFETTAARVQVLVDKLARDYPLGARSDPHEAATNPLEPTRIDRLSLRDLPHAAMVGATTLVIPRHAPWNAIRPSWTSFNALPEGAAAARRGLGK